MISKYDLKQDNSDAQFYLMNNSSSRIFKVGNDVLISAESSGNTLLNCKYMIKVNLIDSTVNYYFDEPEFLDNFFWGPLTPYKFSLAYNSNSKKLITSFAKNPEIDVYSIESLDKRGKINSYVVGSKYVNNFTEQPKKRSKPPLYGHGYSELAPKVNREALFLSLDYDKYSDIYLRSMVLPRSEEQYELRAKGMELTYIILDNDFKKIGETTMPKGKYRYNFYFINKEGIHFANLDEYAKDEDFLTFDIYSPKLIDRND